jgi:deoxyxylulose-5-phosphate synthase
VLLVIVLGITWLGVSNAIREIPKELPIYRRERAAGLSISAYLASKVTVLGVVSAAQAAGEELDATVANMRFVKPIDAELIVELAGNHSLLVSIEENAVIGGAGSEIERVLAEHGLTVPLIRLGLPDRFIDHGEQGQLLAEVGLDKDGIVGAIRARTNRQ